MSEVVLEATNALDGGTYRASIVVKQQVLDYRLAPSSAGKRKELQRAPVTLTATATRPKSPSSMKSPPVFMLCYGIGRLEFDAFCDLVQQILSTCDLQAFTSAANGMAVAEICARYGVVPDQGEFQLERRSIPLMLFDHDFAERGH